MKNRTLSLAFASVIIAGPTFASEEEASTWIAGVESGSEKGPLTITAVGQEAFGEGTMPEGVNDLTADQLDMEAGVEIDAYHELLDVRETDDGWRAIIRADIQAAAPLRDLDQSITDGIMVASPLFETAEDARDWFANLVDGENRFVPSALGAAAGKILGESLTGEELYMRDASNVDLENGIRVSYFKEDDSNRGYGLALLTEIEDGWVIVFMADIEYAEKVAETEAVSNEPDNTQGSSQERGIISSPIVADQTSAQNWLEDLRNGNGEAFVPQFVGRAAVEALGNEKQEFGEFNHLANDIDWNNPVTVTDVNEHYGTVPAESGFVVIINANFTYTAKVAVGAAG